MHFLKLKEERRRKMDVLNELGRIREQLDKIIKLLEKQAAGGIPIREYSAISSDDVLNSLPYSDSKKS